MLPGIKLLFLPEGIDFTFSLFFWHSGEDGLACFCLSKNEGNDYRRIVQSHISSLSTNIEIVIPRVVKTFYVLNPLRAACR